MSPQGFVPLPVPQLRPLPNPAGHSGAGRSQPLHPPPFCALRATPKSLRLFRARKELPGVRVTRADGARVGVARAFSCPASARARAFLQGGLRTVSALTAPGWLAVLNRGGQLTQHGAGGHRQALARLPSLVLLASCMTASSVQTPSNAQTSSCCDSHILCHHETCAPQKDRKRYRHTLIELAKCTPET